MVKLPRLRQRAALLASAALLAWLPVHVLVPVHVLLPPPPFVCALPVLNVVVWRAQLEEVAQFGQDDLLDDDVMMLDVGTAVYLWVGSGANAEEKTKAICALCWRYFHTPQMASNFSAADH